MEKHQKLAKRLKLSRIQNELDEIVETARKTKMSPKEVLEYALSLEVERREARRIELGMTLAHFPRFCTTEGFDFSAIPALDEGLIRDLARLNWIQEHMNVLFLGQPGVSKSEAAVGGLEQRYVRAEASSIHEA